MEIDFLGNATLKLLECATSHTLYQPWENRAEEVIFNFGTGGAGSYRRAGGAPRRRRGVPAAVAHHGDVARVQELLHLVRAVAHDHDAGGWGVLSDVPWDEARSVE